MAARVQSPHTSQDLLKGTPKLPLGLYKYLKRVDRDQVVPSALWHDDSTQIAFELPHKPKYKAHYFQQHVSHDPDIPAPKVNSTFLQRYWFDSTYYKPGGPVFLLDGGETDGEGRLPFLDHGILKILSEATGGIG